MIKKTVDLKSFLQENVDFALSGSNVSAVYSLPKGPLLADIDESQITQALNNIVLNSVQAMPHGGVIRVRAEEVASPHGSSNSSLPLGDDKYVKITIVDEGKGIPKEYLQRIFDPFFTTKTEGTGLGLASAFSIVNKHNGQLRIDSSPGLGTVVFIYLPSSKNKESSEKKVDEHLKGKGKILLMDDDVAIREFAGEMLTLLGYEAEFAEYGEKAVEMYQSALEKGNPYDAVILDLTVPGGMGGKDAIKHLRKMDPQVKAIVSSGYSYDRVMSNHKDYGFKGIVAKPYSINELSYELLRVLELES